MKLKYIIIKNESYQKINSQRNELLKNLQQEYKKGISIIIFSKDRILQLHSLLNSIDNNFININNSKKIILFYPSKKKFMKNYKILSKIKKNYIFIKQKNFKKDLLRILNLINTDKIMFLTDDNIAIQKLNFKNLKKINSLKYLLSLRMGKNIDYSFNLQKQISSPYFKKFNEYYLFKWTHNYENGEWSDPCSLDGHIYNTSEIKKIFSIISFFSPNTLENEFKLFNSFFYLKKGLCFKNPSIHNLSINRVQKDFINRSGNVDIDYLLEQWKKKKILDYKLLKSSKINSTHSMQSLKFNNY